MRCLSCFGALRANEESNKESPAAPASVTSSSQGASRPSTTQDESCSRAEEQDDVKIKIENDGVPDFSFRELAAATQNFRHAFFLGQGGFGKVYRGWLQSINQVVAIKKLDPDGLQGRREFVVEVSMLGRLHHPNLVKLIGYCVEGDQHLIVYEFMPLGSLEDNLHDLPPFKAQLDWKTRMKIAAGAAKGLEYLHSADPPVIFRDLKSSNILLGEDYFPKLSDFGLAKIGPVGDKTHVSTRVMGTEGYCAPEYAMTGKLTFKSDLYSFGVLLLEIVTGRKAMDVNRAPGERHLVGWARPMLNDRRKYPQMVDPSLQGRYPIRGLYHAFSVVSMCLNEQAMLRPSVAEVAVALNFLASQSRVVERRAWATSSRWGGVRTTDSPAPLDPISEQ